MKNLVSKFHLAWLLVAYWIVTNDATDPETKVSEKKERAGRSWHHALFGPQTLLQHQQIPPAAAPTSQPGDASNQQTSTHQQQQQSDPSGSNRNFEDHDRNNVPAASEQDLMSRHFGYLNVHRFDPNFPYYDRNVYPRFPSPHTPRFGPGYRKDKYGHGYGYSCKQGDDCDEVRAANQLQAMQQSPVHGNHPHHHNHNHNPMAQFGNQYPEMPAFPSVPSFGPYGGSFPPAPARFNDLYAPPMMPPMMQPSRYYMARYLHDQEEKDPQPQQKQEVAEPPVKVN